MPAELVVVGDERTVDGDDVVAGQMGPPAQLDVLVVNEQLLAESAQLGEEVGPHRHGRAAGVGDGTTGGYAVDWFPEPTCPSETGDVDDAAARVHDGRIITQDDESHGDADARFAGRAHHASEAVVDQLGVR